MRGAVVARVIPVNSGNPQGHPFKSGRVHRSYDPWRFNIQSMFLAERASGFAQCVWERYARVRKVWSVGASYSLARHFGFVNMK
jgi:hypothetical protein